MSTITCSEFETDTETQDIIKEIDIECISVNRHQPRLQFAIEELEELAQSIKAVGLIHPPVVRPISDHAFELISGERRLRAAQLAGQKKIQVVVRKTGSSLSAQAALIENLQRVDLNSIEIAIALKQLMHEFNLSQEELAIRIGKKRSTVSNYLRLLSLPQFIQDSVSKGLITMGHAKAILAIEGEEKQNLLHELILRDDLTVRAAEKAALKITEKAKKHTLVYVDRDFHMEQLAEKIQHKLGTKVSIQAQGKKGRIHIDFYNYDDLDRLLTLLGVETS